MSVYSCACLVSVSMVILHALMTVKVGGQPTTSDEDADKNNLMEIVKTLKDELTSWTHELMQLEAMVSRTSPDKRTG